MSTPQCVLCGATGLVERGRVATSAIEDVYRELLHTELRQVDCRPPAADLALLQCPACRLQQFWPAWTAGPQLYAQLQGFAWYYQTEKSEFAVARAQIQPGARVLEVGCGMGHFHRYLPSSVRYLGLESNPRALDWARAQGLDVRNVTTAALLRSGERFDCVLAFQVLEHVPQPGQWLQELSALLLPGGCLVLSLPCDDGFLRHEVNNATNFPPHHATRWPMATLAQLPHLLQLQWVDAVHEPLAPYHRRAYASAQVWRVLRRVFGIGAQGLLPRAARRPLRALVAALSLPVWVWTCLPWCGARGHTVTVILRKG